MARYLIIMSRDWISSRWFIEDNLIGAWAAGRATHEKLTWGPFVVFTFQIEFIIFALNRPRGENNVWIFYNVARVVYANLPTDGSDRSETRVTSRPTFDQPTYNLSYRFQYCSYHALWLLWLYRLVPFIFHFKQFFK